MKTLRDRKSGDTVTVSKIRGDRASVQALEKKGILSGSDLTVFSAEAEGTMWVQTGARKLLLSADEIAQIAVDDQLVRRADDPVFFSCCSSGRTGDLWDRINQPDSEPREADRPE